jgi:hypothetical protein
MEVVKAWRKEKDLRNAYPGHWEVTQYLVRELFVVFPH